MARDPAARDGSTKRWRSVLNAVIAGLLVALLCWTVDWRDSLSRLGGLSWPWAAAASALVVVCIVISAWKWQLLLRSQGIGVGLPRLVRLYWVGIFVNNLMPSTFGGDVARLALARHLAGLGPVAASMLVERATGFAVLVAMAFAALVAQPGLREGGRAVLPVAGALAVGMVVLAVLLAWRRRVGRAVTPAAFASPAAWYSRPAAGLLRRLRPLLEALERYGGDHRALLITCGISVLFNGALILSHYTVIHGVHGHLTLFQVAQVAPLVIFVSALPVSVNGIGIAEAAFVLLYGQFGVAPEVALAAALLRRMAILVVSLVGAACWLAERSPGRAAAPDRRSGLAALSSVPPSP